MRPLAPPLHIALLGLLAVAAAPAAAEEPCRPAPAAPDGALATRLDPIVDAAVADGFAGGVALMRDGSLVYDRVAGYADRKGRVPVDRETLFNVASIAKYFTAVLALVAAEEGVIGLDTPIEPWVAGSALAGRGITFLDLLAHRSGLGSSYAVEGIGDSRAALAAVAAQPVDAEAAGGFRYSNDGYALTAILLELAHGRPYEELARQRVLAAACLPAPRFWAEVDLTDPHVVGQPLDRVSRRLRRRNYGMIGSGGLLIGAVDLVRFQAAVAGGGLLSPSSLTELMAPRGEMSIGQATLGAFLVDHAELGRVLSARGYEQWGDNAILNHYLDRDLILAVVTSKGPAEVEGERPRPFRSRLAREIEAVLAEAEQSTAHGG